MAKKFYIQKDVEYKNGQVEAWYLIKLKNEDGSEQFIDCCKNDEEQANKIFENAIN